MVSIKMLRTEAGSNDGIKVIPFIKDRIYPQSGPITAGLADSFVSMGAAVVVDESVPDVDDLSTAPEQQVVEQAPKRKNVKDMTVKELKEFISDTGLRIDDGLKKKDLLEIALDIDNDN